MMPRINFLFVLIIGLTACAPNTAPIPSPVATSSPAASIPPTSTATEISSIPNPIDLENMDLLTRAGYLWDEQTGSLKNKDGNAILSFEDGKWVDGNEVESSLESLKINPTSGVDFDGNPIVAVITIEEKGEETRMYGPVSREWFVPANILASQELMDRELLNGDIGLHNLGDFSYITLEEIPDVTAEFANSDQLLESTWLYLRPWPENVREPKLQCIKEDIIGNHWTLTQYPMASVRSQYVRNIYREREPGERPIVIANDGVNHHLSVVRFMDPETGKWVVDQKIQYWQEGGLSAVLTVRHSGEYTVSGTNSFKMLKTIIRNPAFYVVEPRCSVPEVRRLLPLDLRTKMAQLDSNPTVLSRDAGYYEIDDLTMASLQAVKFYDFSTEGKLPEFYLRLESDPIFDVEFPDRLKD